MNETRYFLLWLMPPILQNIIFIWLIENDDLIQTPLLDQGISLFIQNAISLLFAIFFTVLILALGMDFCKKIGARLLLLRSDYSVKDDIIKPALLVGLVVSGILFAIDLFYPLSNPYAFVVIQGGQQFFYRLANNLLSVISYGINVFLFWFAGIALLIRKILKNTSRDSAMYASIIFISLIWNIGMRAWGLGASPINIDLVVQSGVSIILGVLFWKKGFETAVLCHLIIVFIVQMAALAIHFLH